MFPVRENENETAQMVWWYCAVAHLRPNIARNLRHHVLALNIVTQNSEENFLENREMVKDITNKSAA